MDLVDCWIRSSETKGSFVDIGGIGEYGTNERSSWAYRCGFEKVGMADMEPLDHRLWVHYKKATAEAGQEGVDFIPNINIDDTELVSKLGKWDMVHSTGILYHVPNPMHSIMNLKSITKSDLIINTVVIPHKIETEVGKIVFNPASALFMPALLGHDRDIMKSYFKMKFGWNLDNVSAPVTEDSNPHTFENGQLSYYPYWWLFTVEAFESAVKAVGMKIIERWTWEDHAHFLWLRVV